MGAWDAGSFQNDNALDWAGDLSESGDVAAVRRALVHAINPPPPPKLCIVDRLLGRSQAEPELDSHAACAALVAAEVIAFWLGHPDPHFPDYLQSWALRHSDSLSEDLVTLARRAVLAIKTKSELKDLWEEGDGIVAPKWHEAIADLERRLQGSVKS